MFYRPAVPVPADVLQYRNTEFTKTAWRAGLRPDQRDPQQLREISVEYPLLTRDLVQVRCGNTKVIASVACELVEPMPYKPKHGFFEIHVRQLLHERDSLSKPRDIKRIAAFLERLFKGNVMEMEGLCVLPGRRVWSVAVDVLIINDEGNAMDVSQWAVMAALQHVRRPELTIRGDEVIVHSPQERDPVPLSLHHIPICCTFAITVQPREVELAQRTAALRTSTAQGPHKGPPGISVCENTLRIVVDPSAEEAASAASTMSIAVNAEGQVCAMEKGEGCDIQWTYVKQCIETTLRLAPQIQEVVDAAMKEHEQRREEAVKAQFLWAQKRSGVGKIEETDSVGEATGGTTKRSRTE